MQPVNHARILESHQSERYAGLLCNKTQNLACEYLSCLFWFAFISKGDVCSYWDLIPRLRSQLILNRVGSWWAQSAITQETLGVSCGYYTRDVSCGYYTGDGPPIENKKQSSDFGLHPIELGSLSVLDLSGVWEPNIITLSGGILRWCTYLSYDRRWGWGEAGQMEYICLLRKIFFSNALSQGQKYWSN